MNVSDADISALQESGEFDSDFYVRTYPDVRQTGLDPAAHFLWIGARLGRLAKPPVDLIKGSRKDWLDALFVDGTNQTSSTPYRVDRVAEGLSHYGLKVDCVRGDELGAINDTIRARFVTFFRAPFWETYRDFAQRMRARGSKIVFDIDDLVFDEELIPIIDGYRLLTEPEKLGYVRGVRGYREFMLFSDFCTAPTDYLAGQMRLLGKKAFRVRNTLAQDEITKFKMRNTRREGGRFVVGYYSGSNTHQADFRHAGEALVKFMEENPRVDFRLVGQLDLGDYPKLKKWAEGDDAYVRVKRVDLLPHTAMLEDQLECDVIIAPLEVGNPFCEAKSELKFFEAALAKRAVIASPTQTFRLAAGNGDYAQLADGPEEWLDAYRSAIGEADRLCRIAEKAHLHVIEAYSPAAAGSDAVKAYSDSVVEA